MRNFSHSLKSFAQPFTWAEGSQQEQNQRAWDRDVLKSWRAFYCWELYSRSSFSFDKSIAVSYRHCRADSLRKNTTCHAPNSALGRYIKVKNQFLSPLFERQLSVNANFKLIFCEIHVFVHNKKENWWHINVWWRYTQLLLHRRTIQAIQNWGLNKRVRRQTDRWPAVWKDNFHICCPGNHIHSWSKFVQLNWLHWSMVGLHQPQKEKT